VGGIKEKVLAAHRAGIRTVVLPKRNEKNLMEEVPAAVRDVMTVRLAESVEEVLEAALEPSRDSSPATAAAA
jgi:ATP-dependent Lon protease